MKAVLLAGGLGTRMREETEFRPKPMVEIGGKPILWHIMKILSMHGISDFIVCSGYKHELVSNYFLNYRATSGPFTVNLGSGLVTPKNSDQGIGWNVTVVNTGELTPTGGRIKAVEPYVDDEEFLVAYGDGVADVNITSLIEKHRGSPAEATVTAVQPQSRYGVLDLSEESMVKSFREKPQVQDWINIGYFVFNHSVFQRLSPESVLEEAPLRDLADEGLLQAFQHRGFWEPMDTFREYQHLQSLWTTGNAPWKTWD